MMATPVAANQWLVAMRDLMKYAVKRKLIVANPVTGIAKRPSGNPDGHHTWTPEQVEQFRARHPIGTKARLALELLLAFALRRSDVIRLGPPDVRAGILEYIQFKGRQHAPSKVAVPMPADLAAIMRATPGTGIKRWLLDGNGHDFIESAFSHWFAEMCDAAGLPRKQRADGTSVRLCTQQAQRQQCPALAGPRGWHAKPPAPLVEHRLIGAPRCVWRLCHRHQRRRNELSQSRIRLGRL